MGVPAMEQFQPRGCVMGDTCHMMAERLVAIPIPDDFPMAIKVIAAEGDPVTQGKVALHPLPLLHGEGAGICQVLLWMPCR